MAPDRECVPRENACFQGEKLQRIALTQIVNADGLRHQ